MRKILFAFILLCSVTVFAKEPVKVLKDSFPNYEGVIFIEGKANNEIQSMLREWVALNFKSAKDVVQLDDTDLSAIISKGCYLFNTQASGIIVPNELDFTLDLRFKDGKFKYQIIITDLRNGSEGTSVMNDIMLEKVPVKPNGKPYKGMVLKLIQKSKDKLMQKVVEFKSDLILRLDAIKANGGEDDW